MAKNDLAIDQSNKAPVKPEEWHLPKCNCESVVKLVAILGIGTLLGGGAGGLLGYALTAVSIAGLVIPMVALPWFILAGAFIGAMVTFALAFYLNRREEETLGEMSERM